MNRTIRKKKRTSMHRQPARYPNAAAPGYYVDKLIDGILSLVTVMGAVTVLFFLITM